MFRIKQNNLVKWISSIAIIFVLAIPTSIPTFAASGGPAPALYPATKTVTANYTVVSGDSVIYANASSGPITITFPPSLGNPSSTIGVQVLKTDISSNVVTISNGATTVTTISTPAASGGQSAGVFIYSDGTTVRAFTAGNLVQGSVTRYVSASGNDTNNLCTISTSACSTIQHAVNVSASGDVISVGAGTFTPASISGPTVLTIVGAGSTNTVISTASTCLTNKIALHVSNYATLTIKDLKLTAVCGGFSADDFFIENHSLGYLGSDDVVFGAADNAQLFSANQSIFNATDPSGVSHPVHLTGNATFGFLGTTQGAFTLGVGVTNTVTGNPSYSIFLDLIDGSSFGSGIGSVWSGSATGVRYDLALDSFVDSEQNMTPLPGDTFGEVQSGSYYYTNGGLVCVASTSGCRLATPAPTGLGTGAVYSFSTGSGDQSGVLAITAGTSPSSSGTLSIATPSSLRGPIDTGGACVVTLSSAGNAWSTTAQLTNFYNFGVGRLDITWANGGSALTAGNTYYLNYNCQ